MWTSPPAPRNCAWEAWGGLCETDPSLVGLLSGWLSETTLVGSQPSGPLPGNCVWEVGLWLG